MLTRQRPQLPLPLPLSKQQNVPAAHSAGIGHHPALKLDGELSLGPPHWVPVPHRCEMKRTLPQKGRLDLPVSYSIIG